jgi:hypothetical protein
MEKYRAKGGPAGAMPASLSAPATSDSASDMKSGTSSAATTDRMAANRTASSSTISTEGGPASVVIGLTW